MQKTFLISLLIGYILGLQTLSAQMMTEFNNETYNKIYRIAVSNYQIIELIELKNGEYQGSLNHKVYKLNRKETVKDSIIQKFIIPNQIVKSIITDLNVGGFENLKGCDEIENCIIGLDGTTISFQTVKNGFENYAHYWELTSDYYKQNQVELPSEVLKARRLLAMINERFDLNEQFNNFLNTLPRGWYQFGWTVIKKKRR